eukprot:3936455-Rhodomonas_salina.1
MSGTHVGRRVCASVLHTRYAGSLLACYTPAMQCPVLTSVHQVPPTDAEGVISAWQCHFWMQCEAGSTAVGLRDAVFAGVAVLRRLGEGALPSVRSHSQGLRHAAAAAAVH